MEMVGDMLYGINISVKKKILKVANFGV